MLLLNMGFSGITQIHMTLCKTTAYIYKPILLLYYHILTCSAGYGGLQSALLSVK